MFRSLSVTSLGLALALLAAAQVPPAPAAPPAPPRARTRAEEHMIQIRNPFGPRSYLGVGVADVDSQRAKDLKLSEERGVEIKRVESGSPAEKAGFKEGDVVLEYNGQRVEGTEQFSRMVRETPPSRNARITISRNGANQTLTATIGEHQDSDFGRDFNLRIPPMPPMPPVDVPRPVMAVRTSRVGFETETLNEQLAEYFGVKEGVLVRSVDKDSPAEKAGLHAGDVILKVDGEAVKAARDVSRRLRESWEKKTVPVQVMRNKRETTLQLELPQRQRGAAGPASIAVMQQS
jgi:serine protease Do